MKLFIMLPSFNEEKALPYLFDSIKKALHGKYEDVNVIVINDGSTDRTGDVAEMWKDRLNITILNHEYNMGLGEAMNTAFSYFFKNCSDDDVLVAMDADNTHDPSLIPRMLILLDNGFDVVVASRYAKGGEEIGLSFLRKLCSVGANILLSLFLNIPGVKDYTCGYRAYSAEAVRKGMTLYKERFIEEKGFTCMAEILIKMHLAGLNIAEEPLILRYDLKKGKSKMRIAETIKRYFMLIYRLKRYKDRVDNASILADAKGK